MTRILCVPLFLLMAAVPTARASDAGRIAAFDGTIAGRTTADWSVVVVSDELDYPWHIARSEGQFILTEKAGNIVVLERGRMRRYRLETSQPLTDEGGSGLLGMALSKDFRESGIVYLFHSYRSGSGLSNRVIRARFDGTSWREIGILVDGIPGHRLYNGGRIAIGPDGHLYVTTGWTENREWPQRVDSLAGKILRVTLDGRVPEDNPFKGSPVYSLGHRNPQGLAWNAAGELFVAEHGQTALDEVNLVRPGANYGWPAVSGDETRRGTEPPFLHSGRATWAPSGIAFAGSELLMTALQARGLHVLDGKSKRLSLVFTSNERLRDVHVSGQDLYVITTSRSPRAEGPSRDRLLRLSPRS
jgi:glucose/arabinose dehydrogenase